MNVEPTRTTDEPNRDELFEALADRRRRVVAVLRAAGERLTLAELADELARRAGTDPDAAAPDPERLRIGLYHRHLPLLERAGLVEFDADGRTVRLAGTLPETALAETERTLEIA